jgi:DNA-binding protein HU-beta
MHKRQFIDAVHAKVGGTREAAAQAVDAFFDTVLDTVARGEKVTLTGFGSWERVTRPARDVRSPATGETIHVPATNVPKFKAGTDFKEKVASARKATA